MTAPPAPLRVGVLLEQLLSPVPGGTGRYSAEVARALATRRGLAVAGWTAWHRPSALRAALPAGLPVRRLTVGRRALWRTWERDVGPVPHDVDVVHAPTLLVPPGRLRAPLVVTVHDAVPWTHPETLTARGVRWHRLMGERVVRDAAAAVVPTHAVAERVADALPGLAGRLHVVGEGVSAAVLDVGPDADARAARLRLPGRYRLTLATLEPRKGLDRLVAALALLTRRGVAAADVPLLVVGRPGWGGVDPQGLARRAGLPPGAVRVLGGAGRRGPGGRAAPGGGAAGPQP